MITDLSRIKKHNSRYSEEIKWLKEQFPDEQTDEYWVYADFYIGDIKIFVSNAHFDNLIENFNDSAEKHCGLKCIPLFTNLFVVL